jgi:hypothetical protein
MDGTIHLFVQISLQPGFIVHNLYMVQERERECDLYPCYHTVKTLMNTYSILYLDFVSNLRSTSILLMRVE